MSCSVTTVLPRSACAKNSSEWPPPRTLSRRSARLWTRPGSRLASAGDLGLDRHTAPRAAASGAPLPRPPARRTTPLSHLTPTSTPHPAGGSPRAVNGLAARQLDRQTGAGAHRVSASVAEDPRRMLSFALGIPQRVRAWEIPAACPPHHRGSRFPRRGKWSPRESSCHRRSRHESCRSPASSRLVQVPSVQCFPRASPPVAVPASYRAGDRHRPAFRGCAPPMKGALLTTTGRANITGERDPRSRGRGGVGFALPTTATLQLRPIFLLAPSSGQLSYGRFLNIAPA